MARPDIVTRLDGDLAEIQRFSTNSVLAIVNGVLLLIFSAASMAAMSLDLTVVAAGILPLHLLLRHWARRHVSKSTRGVREWRGVITHVLVETLGAAKAVQSAGAEHWELQVFNTALMAALSGYTLKEAREDREFWGRLVESAVGAHLTNAAVDGACEVFYWRDRGGEVDFVVSAGQALSARSVLAEEIASVLTLN